MVIKSLIQRVGSSHLLMLNLNALPAMVAFYAAMMQFKDLELNPLQPFQGGAVENFDFIVGKEF